MAVGWGGPVQLSQTSPIPRSPDGDNNIVNYNNYNNMYIVIGYDINTPLMTMYEIMTLCKHRMDLTKP